MNRYITAFILLVTQISFAQNFNWITPNKPYLKLYVADDGIYRINKPDFTNSGINTGSIDPRTVKVYYKGSQIPIYFFGEQDGVFNDNDYFDFYGQRNYGGQTKTYKESGSTNIVDYVTDEYFNLYSDTSVYWVDWGGSYGLRFTDYTYNSGIPFSQEFFYSKLQFEKDLVYSLGEHRNSQDYRYFNNEKVSGEGWYWREMQRGNTVSDTFRVPFANTSTAPCNLKLFAYPNSYSDTIFNEHRLLVRVNGTLLDTIKTNDYKRIDTTVSFSSSLLSQTTVNQITVTYLGLGTYIGYMYFDYFSLSYPRKFALENSKLSFSSGNSDTSSRVFKISGFNSLNEINIYDVKNGMRISANSSSSDTLIFAGRQNGSFEIVNAYVTKKPFRIKQKQVPNLVSASNGADYLIVYNKLLESNAEQLRQYRASRDNFRSFKAEIEDIYDIFNYGIENPSAVRLFTKHVYDNWQQPKVKYLVLFGRGSLDPKKNSSSSVYYQNLVPVYGNPVADGYFGNFNISAFTYYQQISVGRIPALTPQEASDIVNKTISYENQYSNPEKWWKNFIFITGGQTIQEQIQFANQSNHFINEYITSCPTGGYPARIFRNDSSGYVTYNYRDSIINAMNSGGLITNYIGHAGSTVWDNGIEGPEVLSNQNKLPLILSMTCFTGKSAETNIRSFGENFIKINSKGSVGFIGTTGWSFSGSGNTLNGYILNTFSKDTLRRIGLIYKDASGKMLNDSGVSAVRNTINCYGLLGDPAAKLLIPQYPEYAISMADYKLSNPFPFIREVITLSIYPQNLGICTDSMKIRYQLLKNNQNSRIKDTIIRGFTYTDSINYNFSIDTAGGYTMKVILDPDGWNTKEIKSNNIISFPISLKNISFVPLKPVDNQTVGDTVEIVGINPNISFASNNVKLLLQVDTSRLFNSSILQSYFNNNPSGVITRFKYALPIKDTNIVYFFRLNSIINNSDTSGWSEIKRFVYNNQPFNVIEIDNDGDIQPVTIFKRNISQYETTDLNNIRGITDSLTINKYTGSIFAQGWGNTTFEKSYVNIDNLEYDFIDSIFWGGLNFVKLNKYNSKVLDIKNIRFSTLLANDSAINYLNTFNENNILIIIKSSPYNTNFGINSSLSAKIKLFGSNYVDSVSLQSYSCWSFISSISFPNPVVSEKYNFAFTPAISSIQPLFYYDSAYIYHNFGPAKSWNFFFWTDIVPSYTNSYLDVYGISPQSQQIKLIQNLQGNFLYNIDTLNSSFYPNVRLVSRLYLDSLNGVQSPIFRNIKYSYLPAPELIADNNSITRYDSVFQDGDTISFSVKVGNYGYSSVNGFVNKWSATYPGGLKVLRTDTVYNTLNIDSVLTVSSKLPTAGLRNPQRTSDTISVIYESVLINGQNEFFGYNNVALTRIVLAGDSLKPEMDITYDGIKSVSGEYISANPKIILKFFDNSKIFIRDTSSIRVKLNDSTVWYYINGVKNPLIGIQFANDKFLQATVFFNPSLSEGENKFQYMSVDNSSNIADTVTHYMYVSSELKILDLLNYPNPMKSQTDFIINLAGNAPPSKSKIKIYSVAGRVIKTIETNLNIGYNSIKWDGRDEDGDNISNGVYLYKIIIEGSNKTESKLQKLVMLK
ncbi:MAG: C25 family cysteine peptidase [Ignavibacteria bacterium]|nr:C25 family cysteine peptidase [Ignavibacteria bacterium]